MAIVKFSPKSKHYLFNFHKDIASRITRDITDPVEAKKIEANFLNNLKNVWELGETYTSGKHSKAMFDEGAYEGSREKVAPVDLQRDIDALLLVQKNNSGKMSWGEEDLIRPALMELRVIRN